jgi:hypothetical protein
MLAAARTADTSGFDALGFLDHYHAPKLEWPYLCGWSLYGALAMLTDRIHLVPMVIDRLNYLPGVLAKETSALLFLSNGRFELGIGAGDFFEEASAWGLAVPDAATRITGLKETIRTGGKQTPRVCARMALSTAILPRASGTGAERAKMKRWLDVARSRFPPPNSGSLVQQACSIEHPAGGDEWTSTLRWI